MGTLVVALEHHFVRTPVGVYTSLSFGYDYWSRYLAVYDSVVVLARVKHGSGVPDGYFRADGLRVTFIDMPSYLGLAQFVRSIFKVLRVARLAAELDACFLLRTGNICTSLWLWLYFYRKPYAREVQGDTLEAIRYFTRSTRPRIGHFIAIISDWLSRIQVKHAVCASYVSRYCQRRYPNRRPSKEFIFSSVSLSPDMVAAPRPRSFFDVEICRFVSVGRLELEKGHHVLIQAAKILKDRGVSDWTLRIIGPGREYDNLLNQVRAAGVENNVEIVGPVKYGTPLCKELDDAHIFVLPSYTEGMPRALIEAMARGLPAIGSDVGGITELLTEDQLVPPGDPVSLANKIQRVIEDRSSLEQLSRRNFEKAMGDYSPERLHQIQRAFWQTLKVETAGWYRTKYGTI